MDAMEGVNSISEGYIQRSQELLEEGKCDEAIAILRVAAMDKSDPNSALREFNGALQADPTHAESLFNQSAVKLQMGDIQGAIEGLTNYLELNPDDPEAFQNRGFAKLQLNDKVGALADFDKSIELQPEDNYGALNNRANLLLNSFDDPSGALQAIDRAIQLYPEDFVGYKNRGCIKVVLRDFEGAVADFNHALALKPSIEEEGIIRELLEECLDEENDDKKRKRTKGSNFDE